MLSHYLKLALRNLSKNPFHSSINIIGLAVGMACSFVIMLFVYGEWSYDRGFANADRIYRIGVSFFNIGKFANGPEYTLDVLSKEFPGMETGTRIRQANDLMLEVHGNEFREVGYYTDTAYFKVFDYAFVAGSPERVLEGPNEIVVTEEMAAKLFGSANAMGETILVGKEKAAYQVTGIVKKPSFNTHLNNDLWLSIQSRLTGSKVWSSAGMHTYVLLRSNQGLQDLENMMNKVIDTHVFPESGQPMGFKDLESYKGSEISVKFYVQRFKEIYLKSKLIAELTPPGNESNIYIFSAISLFILLLAAVNFVNLTTARAIRRAREVGVRKALGSSRWKLSKQFLLESLFTSSLAMVLAVFLSEIFLAVFEYVTGAPLLTTLWRNAMTLPFFFIISMVTGVFSGIYPAFYLTSFMPANVLKGRVSDDRGLGFRNVLVVFQFTVSIALIVGALVVQRQLHFIQSKDLGFDQENVVTIDNVRKLKESAISFKDELATQSGVVQASLHTGEPGSQRVMTFSTYEAPGMENPVSINTYFCDESTVPLYGFRIIKGRNFTKDLASDSNAVIVNEAAAKVLGLPDDLLGLKLNKSQPIVGVVSDFHWESLRKSIQPIILSRFEKVYEIGFKIKNGAIPQFLKVAEAKWKQMVPDEPFQYHFLDDNFAQMEKKEAIFGKAINIFTSIAIFISCLGLYGLASYTAENRTKEIGIRKVLGASVSQIAQLLSKEFMILVVLAFLLASPLAWFAMNKWLEEFAYRAEIEVWMFGATGLLAVLIALITLSHQTISAANRNPTESLRTE